MFTITSAMIDAAAAQAEQRPDRREDAAQAVATAGVWQAPRRVIRGANCQTAVSLDWLRVVGPAGTLDRAMRLLDGVFGQDSRKAGKGLWFYETTERYAAGVIVAYDLDKDDERATFAVEIQGKALGHLSYDDRVKLLNRLLWLGCHCTRLDIAIDVQTDDGGVYLAEEVLQACELKELCRGVRYRYQSGDEQSGLTVYMGQRGDLGSGRFVRVYDKGIETGTKPRNHWQRWETEFSGDVAAETAKLVASAADWQQEALAHATGAVEFREATGKRLQRRQVSQWWLDWLGTIEPKRVRIDRPEASLTTFADWLNRCVGPTLATMAHLSGKELSNVFIELVGQVSPIAQGTARTVVWEYLKEHGIVEQPKLAEVA